jgi:hypothetical protein
VKKPHSENNKAWNLGKVESRFTGIESLGCLLDQCQYSGEESWLEGIRIVQRSSILRRWRRSNSNLHFKELRSTKGFYRE